MILLNYNFTQFLNNLHKFTFIKGIVWNNVAYLDIKTQGNSKINLPHHHFLIQNNYTTKINGFVATKSKFSTPLVYPKCISNSKQDYQGFAMVKDIKFNEITNKTIVDFKEGLDILQLINSIYIYQGFLCYYNNDSN